MHSIVEAKKRIEVRFDGRADWGRGEWVSTLFEVHEAADFVAERGKNKLFEEALLTVASRVPGWGEPAITYDAARELPKIGRIVASLHQDWVLVADSADGKWTASVLQGETVVASFSHERAYEAVIRVLDAAVTAAGGARWV